MLPATSIAQSPACVAPRTGGINATEGGGSDATIILVRHGESFSSSERRIVTRDCRGLTDRGIGQSAMAATWLASVMPRAQVVHSPVERCRQTAAIVAERLGATLQGDHALMPPFPGLWEGRTWVERRAAMSSGAAALDLAEPWGTYCHRTVTVLRQLALDQEGGSLIVVCHAETVRAAIAHIFDYPSERRVPIRVDLASMTGLTIPRNETMTIGTALSPTGWELTSLNQSLVPAQP